VGDGSGVSVLVGEGVSVAGLKADRPCQLKTKMPIPATENKRHAPARQPMTQPVGLPVLDEVEVIEAGAP